MLNEVIKSLEKSIEYLEGTLSVAILIGSPYMVGVIKDGRPMYYGEWNGLYATKKQKGFMDAQAIPDHCCGAICMSPESVKINIAKLQAAGEKTTVIHIRKFQEERLAYCRAFLARLKEQEVAVSA